MIPANCKRLAEVDFPIAEVSRHAVREKSIRHGHPSTLHLWWARRPLASSRAMLMALLLPDPCDPHCPEEFKDSARRILELYPRPPDSTAGIDTDLGLQKTILAFIADFANWDLAAKQTYLDISRALVKAAHGEEAPLVVDPFAGGGSIPLEALRLGCEAFASDLNPVACMILRMMLEDIPRYGPDLAEELRKVGGEIKRQAERELTDLYPADPDGATPIAYLWARTVRCEAPNCGTEIPLIRSFWLCKKAKRKWALRHWVERSGSSTPQVNLEVFKPKAEKDVHEGTVTNARATCLTCGASMSPERVRAQLAAQKGGADVVFDKQGRRTGGARMTAVVTIRQGRSGRHYRLPTVADYSAVRKAQERVAHILDEWENGGKQGLCPVPDERLNPIRPSPNARGLSAVTRYDMSTFGDLFTARQKVALVELARLVRERPVNEKRVVHMAIAICVDKVAMQNSSGCRWKPTGESLMDTFGRQALSMVWDFAESSPVSSSTGGFDAQTEWLAEVIANSFNTEVSGVQQADAIDHPLPDETANVWFTDPPYYDAIPYADLADFFLVWLKRTLPDDPLLRDPFNPRNPLSPKRQECVWNRAYEYEGRAKDAAFFETTISKAFREGRRILSSEGIGSVVFAHQSTEGWEAFLAGLVTAGWTVTGSWPIATEMASRIRARDTASLATSVHLVCRPRPDDATVGEWAVVLRELPRRVGDWMKRLQDEGVRGADLVFACIGPALEIFSRYRSVETAEGRSVELREYLEKVWEVVGRSALQQVLGTAEAQSSEGLAGVLEEDARLSALFMWTYQSTEYSDEMGPKDDDDAESVAKATSKGYSLPFDVVRRFAQPMGIDLDTWTGRIIGQAKGIVRLLPVGERAKDLFGGDGVGTAADWIVSDPSGYVQQALFPDFDASSMARISHRSSRSIFDGDPALQANNTTTLDRLHAAMLLQANGYANALRTLISSEQERGPDFIRLANALSALYPRGSQEKRLLDAMLLAVPR